MFLKFKLINATIKFSQDTHISKNDFVITYGGVCRGIDASQNCPRSDMSPVRVKGVMVYKNYITLGCRSGYDIALIELQKDLKFDASVKPACVMKAVGPVELNPLKGEIELRMINLQTVGFGMNESEFKSTVIIFNKLFRV